MRRLLPAALVMSLLAAGVAAAQDAEGAGAAGEAPGADEYTQRVQAGIALLVAGDNAGARSAFSEAISMDATRPMAPYYLAAANRLGGQFEDALNGFRRAAELGAEHPRWKGRALQGVAETLERMEGRLEEARSAWEEYVRFADSNAAVTFPQMGRARIAAIDQMREQENAYVRVREHIAERERENAESGNDRNRRRRSRSR